MPLCGANNGCGCAITSEPAESGEINGFFPSISVSGSGTVSDPFDLSLDENWAAEVARLGGGCSLYRTTPQSVPDITNSVLTFDAEEHDVGGFHSTSVDTSRITVPAGYGGIYIVTFTIDPTTVAGTWAAWLQVDGSSTIRWAGASADLASGEPIAGSAVMQLAAGQYVEVGIFQNSGGARNFNNNTNNRARFTAALIGWA